MAADDKWYFTKEQLQNTPSRKCGLDADKELSYRQQAANFIQDMGQKLQVSQLCINTAIVYMHRFYMFHSFTHFPWNTIAAAAFFLAAKVEEQPRKLEHVIRIANHCLHREQPVVFDAKSEQYAAQSQDLVFNENVLLQTLGFDVAIDHPHTHVVRCCHLVRASIDLSKTSYFMASNSLHLTTMCLQYKPTVVACFCIHLASKWSSWQIPKSNEGKDWYYYVDKTVTAELLEQLTLEFLKIFDKCPSRLKRKITSISNHNSQNIDQLHAAATSAGSPFDPDSRKYHSLDTSKDGGGSSSFHRSHHDTKQALLSTPETSDVHKKPPRPHDQQQRADYREYREKKERERLEREKVTASSSQHHKSSSSTSSTSSSSSLGVIPGPIPQTGNSKHLPASKPHHRPPPPAGIDQTKMKMHHRPNEIHREHQQQQQQQQQQQKDMTNGRDRYIQQQQQQQSDKQKVPDTNKLPPKYDPNRHRRDLDPKYAQQQQQQQQQQKVPSSRDSVSSVSVVDKQKLAAAANSSNSVQQDSKNFLNKQINSTSQRHKSPFTEINKPSVPVATTVASASASAPASASATTSSNIAKNDSRNGSHWPQQQELPQLLEKLDDGLLSPVPTTPTTTTTSTVTTKKSSLFSPEKTPPQQQPSQLQPQQSQSQKKWTTTPVQQQQPPPPPISPFGSPPPIQSHPKLQTPTSLRRSRTSSSGSEPELRPVLKKLDQISGFENINSKMGIKLAKVPDIIQPICDRTPVTAATANTSSSLSTDSSFLTKELKVPEIIKPFQNPNNDTSTANIIHNGIETDPAVISTLLKEAVNPTQLAAQDEPINVQMPLTPAITPIEFTDKYSVKGDHHHKSEKKKKKDKHKHKDKDKGRDEKKKKHKDKDKERRKDKLDGGSSIATTTMDEVPLKITISKKNAEQPVITSVQDTIVATTGLKVKISRDKIKPDSIGGGSSEVLAAPTVQTAPSTLKIKISKDQIQYNSVVDAATTQTNSSSRKRDRDRDKGQQAAAGGGQLPGIPPTKIMKSSYGGGRDSRQNGKNYYNKVLQIGEGDSTHLRLAESKYQSKGASKTS